MTQEDMQRAHAVVQIKRANIEARRISGIASTPSVDRQGDILDPAGAVFKLPFPLLLGHDHGQPLGEIIDARVTPQGIYIVAQIAPEGISDKIDEAWRMIRAGLIKGLSVGFVGLDWEPLSSGGRRFIKWEIIETSVVVVPANAEAGITEVKRLARQAEQTPATPDFPAFPRALSKADRGLLAEGAASRWADDLIAMGYKAGVKMNTTEQMLLRALGGLLVQHRWAAERIEELEAKHGGQ